MTNNNKALLNTLEITQCVSGCVNDTKDKDSEVTVCVLAKPRSECRSQEGPAQRLRSWLHLNTTCIGNMLLAGKRGEEEEEEREEEGLNTP